MRIISKFKDFYDYACCMYDPEDEIVYERNMNLRKQIKHKMQYCNTINQRVE